MKTSKSRRAVITGMVAVAALSPRGTGALATDGAAQFTIEQVLSAPFPTDLIAAPHKGAYAWVFDSAGRRNVWVSERAADGHYHSRALTHDTEDDGNDMGQLVFTPEADSLVYVRAGDLESLNATDPNPAGFAQPESQALWRVPLNGGEPRKIGLGHSPAVSPRGDSVAYIAKGQIWLAPIDGHAPAQQAVFARGVANQLRWAPDGQTLAFVSNREDHAFIGIFTPATGRVAYIDASTDIDSDPAWSPDGTSIAFLRQSWSKSDKEGAPHRVGRPWSIRIADIASGRAHEVWQAPAGTGSVFHAIDADNQLFWGVSDHIVFPAESDGWTHLYRVAASGGSAQLLTPGAFEVECASMNAARTAIVYASNAGDSERRHVWRIELTGMKATALTSGSGVETLPVSSFDGRDVAFLRSNATQPLRPALVGSANEPVDLAPGEIPAGFPAGHLKAPQEVTFQASDGLSIHGQLFLPTSKAAEKHPALVFLHGGPIRQMLPAFHYMHYYSNAYGMNQYLASRGFVVLAVNYRLGIGYGLNFREAIDGGPSGASEFSDLLGAGRYLQSRTDVDPARIGLWGGSYGGYLTAMGLARASNLFAAGVDFHGVHEWPHYAFVQRGGTATYEPDVDRDRIRVALAASPMADVKTWRSPVLLIHGDDDRNVPFSETVRLVDALKEQNVDVEQLVFPDEIHDFLMHRHVVESYRATADFFARRLAIGAMRTPPGP